MSASATNKGQKHTQLDSRERNTSYSGRCPGYRTVHQAVALLQDGGAIASEQIHFNEVFSIAKMPQFQKQDKNTIKIKLPSSLIILHFASSPKRRGLVKLIKVCALQKLFISQKVFYMQMSCFINNSKRKCRLKQRRKQVFFFFPSEFCFSEYCILAQTFQIIHHPIENKNEHFSFLKY